MKQGLGLILAAVLGLAAAFLNWQYLGAQTEPHRFVALKEPLGAGEPFVEENLKVLEIRGDLGSLVRVAVPYDDQAALYGRPAARDLHRGDLVLWRDAVPPPPTALDLAADEEALPVSLQQISIVPRLLQVGDEVVFLITAPPPPDAATAAGSAPPTGPEYRHIGPFRILSVGERMGRRDADPGDSYRGGDERVITLAIKRRDDAQGLDDDSRRLVEAMDAMQRGREGGHRIVSMLLRPVAASRQTADAAG